MALKRQGFLSQRALAEELDLALPTVSNFVNGKPIDRAIFEEIRLKLALNWKEIADLVGEEIPRPSENLLNKNFPFDQAVIAPDELYQDWGEAPDTITFYGRTHELALLEQWVVQDQCRLVLMLGMGGAGKTTLSVKLLEQIGDRFEAFIWRSLRNAPLLQFTPRSAVTLVSFCSRKLLLMEVSGNYLISSLIACLNSNSKSCTGWQSNENGLALQICIRIGCRRSPSDNWLKHWSRSRGDV